MMLVNEINTENELQQKSSVLTSVPLQVAALTFAHFVVDFFGGVLIPLPEPTLRMHLGVSLTKVMLIISSSAILVNVVQPLASALLPKRRMPVLLLSCPVVAGAMAFIGLTDNYWLTWGLIMLSGLGVGLLHPEASLTVQSLSDKRVGIATSIFMSAGFLGFSVGSLVGGRWGQHLGLHYFWLLIVPGLLAASALWVTGLAKPTEQKEQKSVELFGKIPVAMVLLCAIVMAVNLALIYRMLPIYFVRRFGAAAQGDAGEVLFLIGLCGAIGSFLWGHLSDKKGAGILLILVYLAGMPFFYFIVHCESPFQAMLPAAFFGGLIGGTFPLSVVLVRQASSLSLRLRLGLCIGGAWGTGELMVIFATRYIDCFEEGSVVPLEQVLLLPWLLMLMVIGLGGYIMNKER